jgi:hypothetical protein
MTYIVIWSIFSQLVVFPDHGFEGEVSPERMVALESDNRSYYNKADPETMEYAMGAEPEPTSNESTIVVLE